MADANRLVLVHWNSSETSWDCPCHGSRFGIDGDILKGPAVQELAPVAVTAPAL